MIHIPDEVEKGGAKIRGWERSNHYLRRVLTVGFVTCLVGLLGYGIDRIVTQDFVHHPTPTWPTGSNGTFALSKGPVPNSIGNVGVVKSASGLEIALGIADITTQDSSYGRSVDGGFDAVLKVELSYGDYLQAPVNNVLPKFIFGTSPGTQQAISVEVSASSDIHLQTSVHITLPSSVAYLKYEPNTYVWKHERYPGGPKSKVVEGFLSNENFFEPTTPLESINPRQTGSVTALFRVMWPSLSIAEYEHGPYAPEWLQQESAVPNDEVEFEVICANSGNVPLSEIRLGDYLPPGFSYVRNSTEIVDAENPQGTEFSNGVVNPKRRFIQGRPPDQDPVEIPNLPVGASDIVRFVARISPGTPTRSYPSFSYVLANGLGESWSSSVTNVS